MDTGISEKTIVIGLTEVSRSINIGNTNAIQTVNIGAHDSPVNIITLGGAASELGFYGTTPSVQPASANQNPVISQGLITAAAAYTPADITKIQTELNDLTTLVNQLRADLVTIGLIKGEA